ncbi:hypothetical protein BDZ97DRAFT_1808629 [Flammula alnicola]|nr:hypothetical protein BDZ97DRAFT_1808629 [Flammula alnicola]
MGGHNNAHFLIYYFHRYIPKAPSYASRSYQLLKALPSYASRAFTCTHTSSPDTELSRTTLHQLGKPVTRLISLQMSICFSVGMFLA